MKLNKNDYLLLNYCNNNPRSISNISKELDIAVTNVSARLTKLEDEGLIVVHEGGRGKPTIVESYPNNPAIKHSLIFLKYLKEMNENQQMPSNIEKLRIDLKEEGFDVEEILLFLQEKGLIGFRVSKQGKDFLNNNKNE